MLPFLLGAAALSFVGAGISRRLDPDSIIEDNLNTAFDPSVDPNKRKAAYDRAMRVNNNRYDGESFVELERGQIDAITKQKESYQGICTKLDKALANGSIDKEQYKHLHSQYSEAISNLDEWLGK